MSRIILLGGAVAMVVAVAATTLVFKVTKPQVAQGAAPAETIDPVILTKHLQNIQEEMTLP
jgi:hypothetical protein